MLHSTLSLFFGPEWHSPHTSGKDRQGALHGTAYNPTVSRHISLLWVRCGKSCGPIGSAGPCRGCTKHRRNSFLGWSSGTCMQHGLVGSSPPDLAGRLRVEVEALTIGILDLLKVLRICIRHVNCQRRRVSFCLDNPRCANR